VVKTLSFPSVDSRVTNSKYCIRISPQILTTDPRPRPQADAVSDPLSVREFATRFLTYSTHTGPHVVAATLDPSQRNFNAAQEYLFERGMTAVDLLSGAIGQYVGDQEPSSTQHNPETTDDDVRRWKRARLDLLSKHTVPTPSRSHEIQLVLVSIYFT